MNVLSTLPAPLSPAAAPGPATPARHASYTRHTHRQRKPLARALDQMLLLMPTALMGVLALGTFWLVRNAPPLVAPPSAPKAITHEPDYTMTGPGVRMFDANGQLRHEITGSVMRHFPDTDELEVEQARLRQWGQQGELTTATAHLATSNRDGSDARLSGDALVVREASATAPRIEIRSQYLHLNNQTHVMQTDQPVQLQRGADLLQGDRMRYDQTAKLLTLQGRVRGTLMPRPGALGAAKRESPN